MNREKEEKERRDESKMRRVVVVLAPFGITKFNTLIYDYWLCIPLPPSRLITQLIR